MSTRSMYSDQDRYLQISDKTVREKAETSKKFPISTRTIVIITVIVVVLTILISGFFIFFHQRDEINNEFDDGTVFLDDLINLENAECCLQGSNTTKRWMYDPITDFTYSLDITQAETVCQNLVGVQQTNCLNKITDENGEVKPVAHIGIQLYYGFSPGESLNVCDSFTSC